VLCDFIDGSFDIWAHLNGDLSISDLSILVGYSYKDASSRLVDMMVKIVSRQLAPRVRTRALQLYGLEVHN